MSSLSELDQGMDSLLRRAAMNTPHWARARIRRWDEALFQRVQPFVTDRYWSDRHSINVFSVVGTQHPDYAGLTWLEFLRMGRRMGHNLALYASNPDYYDETDRKTPSMHYQSLDGLRWYVAEDGNHRTAIARFAFDAGLHGEARTMLHGVHLTDYRVDWTFWRIYQALLSRLRRGEKLEPVHERILREDTSGWMHETYRVSLLLRKGRMEKLLDRIVAENELHARLGWRGLLGRLAA